MRCFMPSCCIIRVPHACDFAVGCSRSRFLPCLLCFRCVWLISRWLVRCGINHITRQLVVLWLCLDTSGSWHVPPMPSMNQAATASGEPTTHAINLSSRAVEFIFDIFFQFFCSLFGVFGGISPTHSKFSPAHSGRKSPVLHTSPASPKLG